ncbi:hypothetical protein AX768_02115 [Burkholderia sp. PAMC 28687]|nr:hypothetical protein AX768_02115 [Burkholderia sp. PAMC 28687]
MSLFVDGAIVVILPYENSDAARIDDRLEFEAMLLNVATVMRPLPQPFSRERFVRQARARNPAEWHPAIDFGPPQKTRGSRPG